MLKKSLIMASVLVFASAAMCYAEDTAQKVATPATAPAVTTQKAPRCITRLTSTPVQNSKNVKMLLKNV